MSGTEEMRAFIDEVRATNEQDFGTSARVTVKKLLAPVLSHSWMYVYELIQNARDAGAKRVSWQVQGDSVLFEHDGEDELCEKHVRGIASIGASTKGLSAVGFMGVGFKSVFARFRCARVSGFGWQFRFDVRATKGELGVVVKEWFDTLLPQWDEEQVKPSNGYTTAFLLGGAWESELSVEADLKHLAFPDDLTPLAVLALRGLEEVRVDQVTWRLSFQNGLVRVFSTDRNESEQWRYFESHYLPDDSAMRSFLEVRQELHDNVDAEGNRINRNVVALLPLDDKGVPSPPERGRAYATLPTQVRVPFGIHLQADWLVNVDRQNLREISGDPWQEAIVAQVPNLVRKILLWLAIESDESREHGYKFLVDPSSDEDLLGQAFNNLRDKFIQALDGLNIVPVLGGDTTKFCAPESVSTLPGEFLAGFSDRPSWRADLLFDRAIMDTKLMGERATSFGDWLGWGSELVQADLPWPESLPKWWAAMPESERVDALMATWTGVSERGWHDSPIVLTEAGDWVRAEETRWLNEEPPSRKHKSGELVLDVLEDHLPQPRNRVPSAVRSRVRNTSSKTLSWYNKRDSVSGPDWLRTGHVDVLLSDVVRLAFKDAETCAGLPLIELAEWALSLGGNRKDLVPFVLTEAGPRKPSDAILADPFVKGGESRRELFPEKSALVSRYLEIAKSHSKVVEFLKNVGVGGDDTLRKMDKHFERHEKLEVARFLGIEKENVEDSNNAGYTAIDYVLPFEVSKVPGSAVHEWLSTVYCELREKGRLSVEYRYYGELKTRGVNLCHWVVALQECSWVQCKDGEYRKPGEVLLRESPDYVDAAIADLDSDLASRLQAEGVTFGNAVSKSPVLRRLKQLGATPLPDLELAELLQDVHAEIGDQEISRDEALNALESVCIRGGTSIFRVVKRTGSIGASRSALAGWTIGLADLEPVLGEALKALEWGIQETTSGTHALDFLCHIWNDEPSGVDAFRKVIHLAYKYVLEDIAIDDVLEAKWRNVVSDARLFDGKMWHASGDHLLVNDNDVQLRNTKSLVGNDWVLVSHGHLGDSAHQIRRVAGALGVALLSEKLTIVPGAELEMPSYSARLLQLLETMSSDSEKKSFRSFRCAESLCLSVCGNEAPVAAFIDEGNLWLVGPPQKFAEEASNQLLDFFLLSQRGQKVAVTLSACLFCLETPKLFDEALTRLAEILELEVAPLDLPGVPVVEESDLEVPADESLSIADDSVEDSVGQGMAQAASCRGANKEGSHSPKEKSKSMRGSASEKGKRVRDEGDKGKSRGKQGKQGKPASAHAANQARILMAMNGNEQDGEEVRSRQKKDDHKAKEAVIQYEASFGREAEAMADGQPGFDIRSLSVETGIERRIEVKGVQGIFEDDASVVLSARQLHDALECEEPEVEYWLYVVESNETDRPKIIPIPWTKHRGHLKYGFEAFGWLNDAVEPAVVSANGVEELSVRVVDPLDEGDLEDEWGEETDPED